jgi:aspartokinase/homoserine dehydrogenase 1
MKVLKFGGTSVGDANKINGVISIIEDYLKRNERIAVVCSAMTKITDSLILAAKQASAGDGSYKQSFDEIKIRHIDAVNQLVKAKHKKEVKKEVISILADLDEFLHSINKIKELTPRSLDYIQSFGEYLSCWIISRTIQSRGIDCGFLDTRAVIKTDDSFGYAKVNFEITNRLLKEYFSKNKNLQIVTGFISSTENSETTTLGRGGSDYTASIIGAALDVSEIEIWTDVDGIMTADPRKVENAFTLKAVTYQEAIELSHFGAKVIYPPTMLPALQKKIKIRIKNTFNPSFKGTVILEREPQIQFSVKGISSIDEIHFLQIEGSGMLGIEGITSRIFSALAKAKIKVLMITQGSSGATNCLAVIPSSSVIAKKAIESELKLEIFEGQLKKVEVIHDLSMIAVVGEDMIDTPGISGKVFSALGNNEINIVAIAQGSSQLNITMVIKKVQLKKALNVLHDSIFNSPKK